MIFGHKIKPFCTILHIILSNQSSSEEMKLSKIISLMRCKLKHNTNPHKLKYDYLGGRLGRFFELKIFKEYVNQLLSCLGHGYCN